MTDDMKLYYSNTSPYSRKVRLLIREKGVESLIEEILVNPFGEDSENKKLLMANPLGKIPTLILDNGTALYDSPVICRYLDSLESLADTNSLITGDDKQQLSILRWEAMADGLTDATYNIAIERKRPANEQSSTWIDRWSSEIKRTLLHIEKHLDEINSSGQSNLTLAHLALASAISYLELRFPEGLLESEASQVAVAPKTLAWYKQFKTRPAMQTTQLIDLQK